ncbi:MAG: hypothetical protein WDA27_06855 [Actinomycetota bacterium]
MRKLFRVLPVAALSMALVGLTPMSAHALSFGLSDSTPSAGQVLLVTGGGCTPNGDVVVGIGSILLRQTTTDESGDFRTTVRIPVFASAARHTFIVACDNTYPPGSTASVESDIYVHHALRIFGRAVRGHFIYMRGTGCVPNSSVRLRIDGRVLLTKQTLSTGSFSQRMAIPRATSLGVHKFYALCAQKDLPQATLLLGVRARVYAS